MSLAPQRPMNAARGRMCGPVAVLHDVEGAEAQPHLDQPHPE